MIKNRHASLWRWICARILALAIGSVIVIATCMWLRYAVQNYWIMGRMPPAVRQEFLTLSQNPQANPARFHTIVDTWWGLSYSTPSIASADWVTVALLVLVMIPFIVVMGLNTPARWRCSSAAFAMRQRMSPKGSLAVRQSSSRMHRQKWSALRRTLTP